MSDNFTKLAINAMSTPSGAKSIELQQLQFRSGIDVRSSFSRNGDAFNTQVQSTRACTKIVALAAEASRVKWGEEST